MQSNEIRKPESQSSEENPQQIQLESQSSNLRANYRSAEQHNVVRCIQQCIKNHRIELPSNKNAKIKITVIRKNQQQIQLESQSSNLHANYRSAPAECRPGADKIASKIIASNCKATKYENQNQKIHSNSKLNQVTYVLIIIQQNGRMSTRRRQQCINDHRIELQSNKIRKSKSKSSEQKSTTNQTRISKLTR